MDLNPWRCSPDTSPSLLYHRFCSLMPRIPVLVVYKNIDISLSTQYCAISIFCFTFKREVMRGCERDLHQKQCKTGHRQPNSLTSMFECWKTNNHQSDFWGATLQLLICLVPLVAEGICLCHFVIDSRPTQFLLPLCCTVFGFEISADNIPRTSYRPILPITQFCLVALE